MGPRLIASLPKGSKVWLLQATPNTKLELIYLSGVSIHVAVCATFLSDPLRFGMIRRRSNKSIYIYIYI